MEKSTKTKSNIFTPLKNSFKDDPFALLTILVTGIICFQPNSLKSFLILIFFCLLCWVISSYIWLKMRQ